MLTDEKILHIQETHIGGPTPAIPLDASDWIDFARAIEAAATAPLLERIAALEAKLANRQSPDDDPYTPMTY